MHYLNDVIAWMSKAVCTEEQNQKTCLTSKLSSLAASQSVLDANIHFDYNPKRRTRNPNSDDVVNGKAEKAEKVNFLLVYIILYSI